MNSPAPRCASSGRPASTTCGAPAPIRTGSRRRRSRAAFGWSICRADHKRTLVTESEVKAQAFAMPLTSPAFPRGPYRFVSREYLIVTYRTDPDALRAVIPAPLQMAEPIVKYEFIRMPDSTGFGDYAESGQVIPVAFQGQAGSYVHAMYLDDGAPLAGGRELWGFPKKLASPKLSIEKDTLLGVLRYGPVPVAVATMGYKHRTPPPTAAAAPLPR